jgi:hypothetical protein
MRRKSLRSVRPTALYDVLHAKTDGWWFELLQLAALKAREYDQLASFCNFHFFDNRWQWVFKRAERWHSRQSHWHACSRKYSSSTGLMWGNENASS